MLSLSSLCHYFCSFLATTSADTTVNIWQTSDFSLKKTLKEANQRWVWDCAFSEDSQYLITGWMNLALKSGFQMTVESNYAIAIAALKAWPNACNISTQHVATLLGTTCCISLATLLRYVTTCWMMLDQIFNILDVV